MSEKKVVEQDKGQKVSRFTKEQILSSKRYRDNRDLLQAVLEDSGAFTLEEVEKKIESYRKGRVQ